MTPDEMIEKMARAIMKLGCGYHFGNEQVLCCDPRVGDEKDCFDEPLLRDPRHCDCMLSARAALAAILPVLRDDIARAGDDHDYQGDGELYVAARICKAIRARFDQIAKEIEG